MKALRLRTLLLLTSLLLNSTAPIAASSAADLVVANELVADPGPLGQGGSLSRLPRGEKVFISGILSNRGESPADSVELVLFVNGIATDTLTYPRVIVGIEIPFIFAWEPIRSGDFIIRASADPDRRVSEVTAANNSASRRINVRLAAEVSTARRDSRTAPPSPPVIQGETNPRLPDLLFTEELTVYPDARVGLPVSVSATILNGGDTDAGKFTVRLDADGVTQELPGSGALRPGEWTSVVFRWIPRRGGRRRVVVTIDPDDAVAESLPDNNRAVKSVRVRPR